MRSEGRHRANLIDRCWFIYLSLADAFSLPENFHVEFPGTVETTLVSGAPPLHYPRRQKFDTLPARRVCLWQAQVGRKPLQL